MPLNIAEGAWEFSPKAKSRFYRIARRSAGECAAILDLAHGMPPDEETDALKGELSRINAMLTGLIGRDSFSAPAPARRPGPGPGPGPGAGPI